MSLPQALEDAPALSVVSQDELDVLRTLGRRKLSDAPTAKDIYLAIAQLGGYINKNAFHRAGLRSLAVSKNVKPLRRGWTAAKLQQRSDQP